MDFRLTWRHHVGTRDGCDAGWLVMVFAMLVRVRPGGRTGRTAPSVIHLASEDWEDYTAADGHGLGWDVLRKVFEPAGVKLDIRTEPYMRSHGAGRSVGSRRLVGSYRDESERRAVSALELRYRSHLCPGPGQQPGRRPRKPWANIDWPGSAATITRITCPTSAAINEVKRRTGILSMLTHNRADFYIDALTEVEYCHQARQGSVAVPRTHIWLSCRCISCFAKTPKARALMALFDQRMEQLVKSGELKPIFERWKQPYPFDPN